MSNTYAEVKPEDFSKISRERLPHQEIESALILIGGGGVKGTQYKISVIREAGWNKGTTIGYAHSADVAANAFNRVRQVLVQTDDPDQLLEQIKQSGD